MKKVMLTLACVLFAAGSSASAMPIALDASAALGNGALTPTTADDYGVTGVFTEMQFEGDTVSTDNANGTFSDNGTLNVTDLLGLTGSKAWLNTPEVDAAPLNLPNWFLVGSWTNLQGVTSMTNSTSSHYDYTPGTGNLILTATDGISNSQQVATLTLNSGYSDLSGIDLVNGTAAGGSFYLDWEFTSILSGFWLDENGNPLSLAQLQSDGSLVLAISHGDTFNVSITLNPDQTLTILSDHDGSMSVGVVPEPATMALFGTGLFGLAGAGLRRKKS